MTRSARAVVYALALAAGIAHAAEPPAAVEFARIDAEFEAARERCDALAGQPKDVCLAEARADRRIRKAEVAARGQGTIKGWYDAKIARAEAEFGVAKERCGVHAGADRETCVADARQREARVKDEARRARDEAETKTGDGRGGAK